MTDNEIEDKTLLFLLTKLHELVLYEEQGNKSLPVLIYEIQGQGVTEERVKEYKLIVDKIQTALGMMDKKIKFECTMNNVKY